MEKAIELNIKDEELKKYFEERLKEENIEYEINIEDRWIEKYKDPSKFYQVYCIYVNSNNIEKVKQFMKDFENATIITDGIEEFQNIDEEENIENSNIFTIANLLKFFLGAIILMGIATFICLKFI